MKGIKCSSNKIMFYYEKDAWLFALRQYLNHDRDQGVYVCRECRYYHLTSRKGFLPQWVVELLNKKIN